MKTVLVVIFVVGFASSAILDNKSSSKTDWDDGDSMTLGGKGESDVKPDKTEDPVPSPLIGNDEKNSYKQPEVTEGPLEATSQASQEAQDSQEQVQQTTPGSGEEGSTSGPRVEMIELLRRVPLTFEIISFLQPENDKVKQAGKRVGFFPEQSGETGVTQKAKENEGSSEEETTPPHILLLNGKGEYVEVPQEPLRYMVPPRPDEENPWNKYPLQTTPNEEQYTTTMGADPQMISTMEPQPQAMALQRDPRMEKWDEFQKETGTTMNDEGISTTSGEDTTMTTEAQQTFSDTPITEDINALTTITPPPIPTSEDEQQQTWQDINIPTPRQPEMDNYYNPRYQNLQVPQMINYRPQWKSFQEPPMLPKYQYHPEMAQMPQMPPQYNPQMEMMSPPSQMMYPPKQPSRPMVIPTENIWPRKYFAYQNDVSPPNYPFISRNNDYYRPQRSMLPSASPLWTNSIQEQQPMEQLGYNQGADYRNPNYNYNNYYSGYPSPASYEMSYRPSPPRYRYKPLYSQQPTWNSESMYAPMYPYQQRRMMQMHQQPEFY